MKEPKFAHACIKGITCPMKIKNGTFFARNSVYVNLVNDYFLRRMHCSPKKSEKSLSRKVSVAFAPFDEKTEATHAHIEAIT